MRVELWLLLLTLTWPACRGVDNRELIGWQGESFNPETVFQPVDTEERSEEDGTPWVQTLSWKPRAFVYHNFLRKSEIKHILELAASQMKRSTVVGGQDKGVVDNIRTSAGCFIQRHHDAVIDTIEQRLALWTHLPVSFQEDMQVLRYGPTNKYGPHCDGLSRVMSVLIYLVAPEEGGETAFPASDNWLHPEMGEPKQGNFSECAKGHVAYKPVPGDALMFYDMLPTYHGQDHSSMHTGCPVVKGIKWNAVKWIHGTPFRGDAYEQSLSSPPDVLIDPGMCIDAVQQCKLWADSGECKKNVGYMVGENGAQGKCRAACGACKPCEEGPGQAACIAANREEAGYMNIDPAEFKLT